LHVLAVMADRVTVRVFEEFILFLDQEAALALPEVRLLDRAQGMLP
jgi:hypothetical protein